MRWWFVLGLLCGVAACGPQTERQAGALTELAEKQEPSADISDDLAGLGHEVAPPADPGAMAPNLLAVDDQLFLTWIQKGTAGQPRHRLQLARWQGDSWGEPLVVAEGDNFFANWADFPSVTAEPGGSLLAHWLAKTGEGTYAYSIQLARSRDGGRSWEDLGLLNNDRTDTEHGFVTMIPEKTGVRAIWLDGREMIAGQAMGLRTALIRERPGEEEVLDSRVCECCQTGGALAAGATIVAYRDRSEDEVRDIYTMRRTASDWSRPRPVHADNWKIPGCPVNGPKVAAFGDTVTIAWFTGAQDDPRVQVSFSSDAGESFGEPVLVDGFRPLGRIDASLIDAQEALVSWLAVDSEVAEVKLRRVRSDGSRGVSTILARTGVSRASGFPQLERIGHRLYLAWVETAGDAPSKLRFVELPLSAIPAPV